MTVLIIGASGFIGGHLYRILKKCAGLNIVGTCFSHHSDVDFLSLDATDKLALKRVLREAVPDVILLVAGNKNVKECEQDYEKAYRQNVLPLMNMAGIMREDQMKSKVILFSSDYVFDGLKGLYSDIDVPCPATNYGKTKLIAEQLLLSSSLDGKVIRTAAVIGQGSIFWEWLCQNLRTPQECKMFSNVYFSPTSIDLLGDVVAYLINNYKQVSERVVHVTNGKRMSRFEFAVMCQKLMKESRAKIIREEEANCFPHDLSLRPSRIQQQIRVATLEEYIRGVIND
jgi:dTDP-4-dehydrorhamnose reductase